MSTGALKKRKITDFERRVVQSTVVLGNAMDEIVARRDFFMFEATEKVVSEMLRDARVVLERASLRPDQ